MGIAFTQIVPFVFLPLMTLQNIDFVPTAVLQKKKERKKKKEKKKAGRKWIPLKLTDRLSTHMFQMFSVLHKWFYNTSTVNSSSNPRLSHSGVEKCVQNGSAGTTNLTYSDFRFSVYTRP